MCWLPDSLINTEKTNTEISSKDSKKRKLRFLLVLQKFRVYIYMNKTNDLSKRKKTKCQAMFDHRDFKKKLVSLGSVLCAFIIFGGSSIRHCSLLLDALLAPFPISNGLYIVQEGGGDVTLRVFTTRFHVAPFTHTHNKKSGPFFLRGVKSKKKKNPLGYFSFSLQLMNIFNFGSHLKKKYIYIYLGNSSFTGVLYNRNFDNGNNV